MVRDFHIFVKDAAHQKPSSALKSGLGSDYTVLAHMRWKGDPELRTN